MHLQKRNQYFSVICAYEYGRLCSLLSEVRQTVYGIPTGSCLDKVRAYVTIFVGTDSTKILVSFLKLQ